MKAAVATAKATKRTRKASLTLMGGKTNSSAKNRSRESLEEKLERPPLLWAVKSYISYIFLVVAGYLRELIWGIGPIGDFKTVIEKSLGLSVGADHLLN